MTVGATRPLVSALNASKITAITPCPQSGMKATATCPSSTSSANTNQPRSKRSGPPRSSANPTTRSRKRKEVKVAGNNRHHILAKSRHGKDTNNIVSLPASWHLAWHVCFDNLTVQEAHRLIDLVMVAGKEFSGQDIENLRQKLKEPVSDEEAMLTYLSKVEGS